MNIAWNTALGDKTLHRFQGRREGVGEKRMREWGWSSVRDGINCHCDCVCVCVPRRGLINKWCLKWEQLSIDHLHFMKSACLQFCTHTYTHIDIHIHVQLWLLELSNILLLSFPGTCLSCEYLSVCSHLQDFILHSIHVDGEGMGSITMQAKANTHTKMHINTYLVRDAIEH